MSRLLLGQDQSPKHRLLAQLGAIYTVSRSHILPHLCLVFIAPSKATAPSLPTVESRTQVAVREHMRIWAQHRILIELAVREPNQARTRSQALELALELSRVLARARIRYLDQYLTQILVQNLPHTASSVYPEWLLHTEGLATDVAWAEWLFAAPDTPTNILQLHINTLEKLAIAPDDWTRLLGLTGLMLLGEGTPQRCAERNALLDQGMQHPATFTFPSDVRDVTDTAAFHQEFPELLQIIFLHKPGEPWLQPEWFDPARPEARFFRARPREFFARAAEVLDPEGKTELAKWRQTE